MRLDCFDGNLTYVVNLPPYHPPAHTERDVNGDQVQDLFGPWVERGQYTKTFDLRQAFPTPSEENFDFIADLIGGSQRGVAVNLPSASLTVFCSPEAYLTTIVTPATDSFLSFRTVPENVRVVIFERRRSRTRGLPKQKEAGLDFLSAFVFLYNSLRSISMMAGVQCSSFSLSGPGKDKLKLEPYTPVNSRIGIPFGDGIVLKISARVWNSMSRSLFEGLTRKVPLTIASAGPWGSENNRSISEYSRI